MCCTYDCLTQKNTSINSKAHIIATKSAANLKTSLHDCWYWPKLILWFHYFQLALLLWILKLLTISKRICRFNCLIFVVCFYCCSILRRRKEKTCCCRQKLRLFEPGMQINMQILKAVCIMFGFDIYRENNIESVFFHWQNCPLSVLPFFITSTIDVSKADLHKFNFILGLKLIDDTQTANLKKATWMKNMFCCNQDICYAPLLKLCISFCIR